MERPLSRRDFLNLFAVATGAGVLAACSPSSRGPVMVPSNSENEKILGSEIPQNSNIDYVGQIDNQGQTFGFYRVEQQNNLQEQARALFELIATEEDRNEFGSNPMDFFMTNFVPNFENPNTYIDSRPLEEIQKKP